MPNCSYRVLPPIRMADLFGGSLNKHGVQAKELDCLTDEHGVVWVHSDGAGRATTLSTYEQEQADEFPPFRIFAAICDEFNAEIVSEYDSRFWGYTTYKEWKADRDAAAKKADENFYDDVMNYIRKKPHRFGRGTIGMARAQIAKRLIKKYPELAARRKCSDLVRVVDAFDKRDHTQWIGFSKGRVAKERAALEQAAATALAAALSVGGADN
jgi:hypothetical protein